MNCKRLSTLLLCLVLSACGTSITSQVDYGTIINTAHPPTNNIFPDFDAAIPELSLQIENDTQSPAAHRQSGGSSGSVKDELTIIWRKIFQKHGIAEMHRYRDQLEDIGAAIAQAITSAKLTSAGTVTVEGELTQKKIAWRVEFAADVAAPSFRRYFFYDQNSGHLIATYLVKTDSSGVAMKGLFAFVDIVSLPLEGGTDETSIDALAFDFSNPQKNLLIMRNNRRQGKSGYRQVKQLYQQFNELTREYIGEDMIISEPAPSRSLNKLGFRFSWNDQDFSTCFATISYQAGIFETLQTYGFTGPNIPSEENITTDECSVPQPHWGTHIFDGSELLFRYEDTVPPGGSVAALFDDGKSKTGWESLSSDLIDTWLDASRY